MEAATESLQNMLNWAKSINKREPVSRFRHTSESERVARERHEQELSDMGIFMGI